MSAGVRIVCPEHWSTYGDWCDDDAGYPVESVATARALHAAAHPHATGKTAVVVIGCEARGCHTVVHVRDVATVEQARELLSSHRGGWYRARRAGRLIDACQWHLGACCIQHARPLSPTVDRTAVLPGEEPQDPQGGDAQMDLLTLLEAP